MKTWQATAIAVAVSLASACGDVETSPTIPAAVAEPRIASPTDSASLAIVAEPGPAPVDDAISPLKHITWIDVQVDVGWMDPNTAYGQAIVRYGANNAVADVDLSVRNAQGTLLATSTGHAQASYFLPGDHTLYASTNAYVAQTCGAAAQATARGNVFDSFLTTTQSLASWGQKAETSGRTATQPACAYLPPPTSPTGGDGSTTPPTGGTTQPPTYQPAPFVPSGHWECVVYYRGTDYERQYCTWYADYARLPRTSPAFALIGGGATLRTLTSVDLPRLFVIVSDQVPADAMAVIERRRQGPFKNVLLVPSSTVRPAVLVAALRALADSRSRQGETPSTDLQLTLKGGVLDQQIPAAARDYAASFTTLIANAKRGDAGAYGTRPLLEIQLGDMK